VKPISKPIEASAPSNIALIKYMGKTSTSGNLPTNSSLSYTLEHLRSFVVIEPGDGEDKWRPLPGFPELKLSDVGREKFLKHFDFLKREWNIPGFYTLKSANNFPSDCGLASSASSFAALTLAASHLARELHGAVLSPEELSRWSRKGSGSSCRSFFTPWAIWRGDGAESVEMVTRLEHAVVLVEEGKKAVSSSEAHKRVASSLLFQGRVDRAELRLKNLLESLGSGRWRDAFEICWSEFQDMHALFETSNPSFGYFEPKTVEVLAHLRDTWNELGDGPLVTRDAGANIHLLFRPEQTSQAKIWLKNFKTLTSWT
jgi:diphosphomevalonate decarboxylase